MIVPMHRAHLDSLAMRGVLAVKPLPPPPPPPLPLPSRELRSTTLLLPPLPPLPPPCVESQ